MVAEGVEDKQTLDLLCEIHRDQAQGNFLSRPMLSVDFIEWHKNQRIESCLDMDVT